MAFMLVTRLKLKNWRNFREVDVALGPRGYVIGANASGKSNLLDVFRFLRTIAQADGGGLQKALKERKGLGKLRSLHARREPEVRIEVEVSETVGMDIPSWRYVLAFKSESRGQRRVLVHEEAVFHKGKELFSRPTASDKKDTALLTQTFLEQIASNSGFRPLAEHFASTTYLHLVPQLLKHGDEISGRIVENDPFGQSLLQRIAKTPGTRRAARLKRIQEALAVAVPQFSELHFDQDPATGIPHLRANFRHWRVHGSWQREDQFSDGTLRLIGFLWALQEGEGLLLLEEPELSLNDAIVEHIPVMIDRVLSQRKGGLLRQVISTTHSDKLVAAVLDVESVLLLEFGDNGTTVRQADEGERQEIEYGLNPAEVLLPKTRPRNIDQMGLFA
jgi:predicted ATPase